MKKTLESLVVHTVRRVVSQSHSRRARVLGALTLAASVAAIALVENAPARAQSEAFTLSGRMRHVADGDTFTLVDRGRRTYTIRLASIDAPEMERDAVRRGQPLARESKKRLSALIRNKDLSLDCYEHDLYQRSVCDVRVADEAGPNRAGGETKKTVNQILVEEGLAWANQEKRGAFLRDESMLTLEDRARRAHKGIWQRNQEPVAPWVWRYQCWKKSAC